MKIALIANKGGVGKTTVTLLLYEAIRQTGPAAALGDLDNLQGSATKALERFGGTLAEPGYLPLDLDALTCTAEVIPFDLRPFTDVAWIQPDGTKVWLTEAEQPLPSDWGWRW
jgi:hypothetical protein